MQVTLKILAEDIYRTEYSNPYECAITRALGRAGLENYWDSANGIRKRGSFFDTATTISDLNYVDLSNRVKAMYTYAYKRKGLMETEGPNMEQPQDFEVTLNLNI